MKNLFAISGPSGTGKTTLCRMLQRNFPDITFSVSCTTRAIRSNEIEDKDYHFMSMENFSKKITDNKFIEYESVHGDYYGTLRSTIDNAILNNNLLLLEVDVKGAKTIKSVFSDNLVTIFILPPSIADLRNRLKNRGTDSDVRIKKRMDRLELELNEKDWFDYHIINNQLENAMNSLVAIIKKQSEEGLNES